MALQHTGLIALADLANDVLYGPFETGAEEIGDPTGWQFSTSGCLFENLPGERAGVEYLPGDQVEKLQGDVGAEHVFIRGKVRHFLDVRPAHQPPDKQGIWFNFGRYLYASGRAPAQRGKVQMRNGAKRGLNPLRRLFGECDILAQRLKGGMKAGGSASHKETREAGGDRDFRGR